MFVFTQKSYYYELGWKLIFQANLITLLCWQTFTDDNFFGILEKLKVQVSETEEPTPKWGKLLLSPVPDSIIIPAI